MRILVTGFDPFGGEAINPSWEAVRRLPKQIAGAEISAVQLPTSCERSLEVVERSIAEVAPRVVLSVGQAGGRRGITVERVGINVDDYRIPDNDGVQPVDQPVVSGGPDAYFSNLPIKAMVEAVRGAGLEASVSNSAGTFVCNHVLYGVRHLGATRHPGLKSGFVHVPFLPEQVKGRDDLPSMTLEDDVRALAAAIQAIVDYPEKDIRRAGGSIC